jgi:hypothetical protein
MSGIRDQKKPAAALPLWAQGWQKNDLCANLRRANCIGLTWFKMERKQDWLHQSNQPRVSSFTWRRVTKRCPCRRSTFSDLNRVSLQTLSQSTA